MNRIVKSVLFLGALLAFAPALESNAAPVTQTVVVGPYAITLEQSIVVMKTMPLVTLEVRKDGRLATDLLPYGGSSGLAEFTNRHTGTTYNGYINPLGTAVSSMTPSNVKPTKAGPKMEISMPNVPAGVYKLVVHVRGAGAQIYTASFDLEVR